MFVRKSLPLFRSLTSTCYRQIGYLDIDNGISPTKDLEPKEYDPDVMPQLFTELDPADIEKQYDSEGNQLSGVEMALREAAQRAGIAPIEPDSGKERQVS